MAPTALITGVAGQDGVLLARHLLDRGYRVVGTREPDSPIRLACYLGGVDIVEHDLSDTAGFAQLLEKHRPAEVYNLAGFTSVGRSWDDPALVHEVNAAAVERILDVLLDLPFAVRFFQASSSEVFGPQAVQPQSEDTEHDPQNPYAESKSAAHRATQSAREAGLFAVVGILYNHESVVRAPDFVTRKITRAMAEIALGRRSELTLGNLDVSRDWGAAREYVAGMHAALTHDEPGDYILATGRSHTLGDLLGEAARAAGVAEPWAHVRQDPQLLRVADNPGLVGDPGRADAVLGWRPRVTFADLVAEMVSADIARLTSGVEEHPRYLALHTPAVP